MTIDEAIETLKIEIPPIPANEWSKAAQAKALGIEALKQIKESRFDPGTWIPHTLPGETNE